MKSKPVRSLWLRLVASLVGLSLLAVAAATLMLYERFKVTNSVFRERTLQNHARVVSRYLRRLQPDMPVRLSEIIAEPIESAHGKFALVDTDGHLLDASPDVTRPLVEISHVRAKDYFVYEPTGDDKPLYGLSTWSPSPVGQVWVQVAFHDSSIIFDSVLEEFVEDIGWIWVPFVISMLGVNLLVARLSLRPLRIAAAMAERVDPQHEIVKLPEDGLPSEVLALVGAVNRALDRMGTALQSQRHFVADAAHELRTPVAVLKAHAAVLPSFDGVEQLKSEIDALERLINQLLDSARLDGLAIERGETVDLERLAADVASQLGPFAIAQGRSIEIDSPDQPVVIAGSYDFLYRAVRNLVENAIKHTPRGTSVSIRIEPPGVLAVADHGPGVATENRTAIFQRFWQGGRDRGGGAGLGLDIVARTVAAHRGQVVIDDVPGGGAIFKLDLSAKAAPFRTVSTIPADLDADAADVRHASRMHADTMTTLGL